ncbi:hypothetical protein Tco_0629633 [Tanacetum coccineum]|uniref:Uncharacterized protein n=1 Tax=Tanacetum coccineum TaxID=301880 RepID=A0ABQ4WTR3_9ASTR
MDWQCLHAKRAFSRAPNHDDGSIGFVFSNKRTNTVPEKTTTPRSCLRWQPTGRILKTVCLRWVPTGRLFNSCTSKVENEPTHGSMVDIPHIHAYKQTLGLSAGTSLMVKSKQRIGINCGREFRVLIGYDLKSFDENEVNDVNRIHRHEDRGLICCDQTSFDIEERGPEVFIFSSTPSDIANEAFELRVQRHLERFHLL